MIKCIVYGLVIIAIANSGTSVLGNETYCLKQLWKLERQDDPEFSLFDLSQFSAPQDLFGVRIDEKDRLIVADRISYKLLSLNEDGSARLLMGGQGQGPEEFFADGEPIDWPGFVYARTNCDYRTKIVGFDEFGKYSDSIDLEGEGQVMRMWEAGDSIFGITSQMRRTDRGGVDIKMRLYKYNKAGGVESEMLLRERELPPPGPGVRIREEDLEVAPIIGVGYGRIYVVYDRYEYRIDCLNWDLEKQWTYVRESKLESRPKGEASEDGESWKTPAEFYPVIRRLVPRSNGDLWIEMGGPPKTLSRVEYERLDSMGEPKDSVMLVGGIDLPGNYVVWGDRLLWKSDDDLSVPDGDDSIPYFVLYEIK